MSIPFIDRISHKIFLSPLGLFIPFAFALEGMRRCWLSGTALTLFIDIGSSLPESCLRDCENLRRYLDVDTMLIEAVPEALWPAIGPWIDHHNAQECFYEIALELCYGRNFPPCESCKEVWESMAPPAPWPR